MSRCCGKLTGESLQGPDGGLCPSFVALPAVVAHPFSPAPLKVSTGAEIPDRAEEESGGEGVSSCCASCFCVCCVCYSSVIERHFCLNGWTISLISALQWSKRAKPPVR